MVKLHYVDLVSCDLRCKMSLLISTLRAILSLRENPKIKEGCQMAIAGFLDRMCLALRASGLWLRYATLQN